MHAGHRRHGMKTMTKVGVFYLFVSLGTSLVATIWAIYLDSFFHNASSVGFLSSVFTALGILSCLLIIPLVEKKSKTQLLSASLFFFAISYFIFSIFSSVYLVIILGIFIAIFSSLRIITFGLLVRDKTNKKNVSKNEGLVYTILNGAWLIGPLVAGYLLRVHGFKSIFFVSALLILSSIFLMKIFNLNDNRKSKIIDFNIFKIACGFFSGRERRTAYIISGAVTFWWALVYIYIPVTIVERGYGSFLVGIFLAGIIVPLILLEYVFGRIGGKYGFKKLFFSGFIILGGVSLICFFVSNIYLLMGLLVLASVGVAMIESTSEAYFFDIIGEKQRDKYYGVYNTAIDIGYLFGTLPCALILLFLPFNFIFLFFAASMFILSLVSLKIKDAYEFRRR